MLARDEIVAALTAGVPTDVDVIGYARNVAAPTRSTVMVRIDKVTPSKVAGSLWQVEAALVLIGAVTTPGPGDDELDALLQDVLVALDTNLAGALTWSAATRATYAPDGEATNPAYEVAVTTQVSKEH